MPPLPHLFPCHKHNKLREVLAAFTSNTTQAGNNWGKKTKDEKEQCNKYKK